MPHKIIFMGTPKFSVPTLEALAKSSYKISCVYTQPSKQSKRGHKLNSSPIQKSAEHLNLTIRSPNNLNTTEEFNFFIDQKPDIVVVVAYGQLIPKKFLEIPKKGFINIHASLLPSWRGAAPIQRAIMNLDKETGISIMKITEELDSGPVMKKIKLNISSSDTSGEISEKLSKIGSKNIIEVLDNIFEDKVKFIDQEHNLATYAKKIKKNEGKIDWEANAKEIIGKINGLNPDPGAWFEYKKVRYKIWKVSIFEKKGLPGTILDDNFTIACNDKSIKIIEIQREGKNKLLLKDFLLGTKIQVGDIVK
ncbi:MAG: methionyl-tRNA formyltransferase [Proteobacteria bacterium]|nr:methionyl-tRNA formyltransferase [Pseudomonadota bacterium]